MVRWRGSTSSTHPTLPTRSRWLGRLSRRLPRRCLRRRDKSTLLRSRTRRSHGHILLRYFFCMRVGVGIGKRQCFLVVFAPISRVTFVLDDHQEARGINMNKHIQQLHLSMYKVQACKGGPAKPFQFSRDNRVVQSAQGHVA